MASIKISGNMKVKTLRERFKDNFSISLRLYKDGEIANDNLTISEVREKRAQGGELNIRTNILLKNLEQKLQEDFGIKAQVVGPDDSEIGNKDITLKEAIEKLTGNRAPSEDDGQKEEPAIQEDIDYEIKIWDEEIDKDYEHEISETIYDTNLSETGGRGYICKNCSNNRTFSGYATLFRIYENSGDGDFDFQEEFVLPEEVSCEKCGSHDIILEYKKGWAVELEAVFNDENAYRAVNGSVSNFADADGLYDVFKHMGINDTDLLSQLSRRYDDWTGWENEGDSSEFDEDASKVIVSITAKGTFDQINGVMEVPNCRYLHGKYFEIF